MYNNNDNIYQKSVIVCVTTDSGWEMFDLSVLNIGITLYILYHIIKWADWMGVISYCKY